MNAAFSATLARLYRVLGDFRMSSDNVLQNLVLVVWFSLAPLTLNLHMKSHSRSGGNGAKQF